jgi:hypothetical protein
MWKESLAQFVGENIYIYIERERDYITVGKCLVYVICIRFTTASVV